MKRGRISLPILGAAVSAVLLAALWPHAREAGLILLAQDDPVALADQQIDLSLRNNESVVAQNV